MANHSTKARVNGPVVLVLASQFSQGNPFLQKESNKQSASMMFGLVRLVILTMVDRKCISRGTKLSATHAFIYFYAHKVYAV